MLSRNAMRHRAQKHYRTLTACEACGATENLQRHHPNYQEPDRVEILCAPCHVKADLRDGTRRAKQPKSCKLCGTTFLPTHSTKHSLCSAKCRSEVGRRNAMKRWSARSGQ